MDSLRSTKEKGSSFELIASSDDDFGAGYKRCKVCGEEQPFDNFRVEAKGVMGRKAICKKCVNTAESWKRNDFGPKTKGKISNDRIQKALEEAAYRIIKESM